MSVAGPEVIFYVLHALKAKSRAHGACYVAAEYWRRREPLCLYTTDHQFAEKLNGLLWTFTDAEFIPHSLCGQEESGSGIVIGWGEHLPVEVDRVVNLADDMPDSLSAFSHIIEIVLPDEVEKKKARQRYRQGQEKGWKLTYREMDRWEEVCERHES